MDPQSVNLYETVDGQPRLVNLRHNILIDHLKAKGMNQRPSWKQVFFLHEFNPEHAHEPVSIRSWGTREVLAAINAAVTIRQRQFELVMSKVTVVVKEPAQARNEQE